MKEYSDREKRITCVKCGHPLSDNRLVCEAYSLNTRIGWAVGRLNILADMARDRGMEWFADEVKKTVDGIGKGL